MGRQSSQLDRQVRDLVLAITQDDTESSLSVDSVYQRIQRSNSSLKRTKRRLLEDSIERILDELKDSESSELELSEKTVEEIDLDANAMNKRMRESMRRQLQSSELVSNSDEVAPTANILETSKATKKRSNGEIHGHRPSKRSKTSAVLAAPDHITLADIGGMDSTIDLFVELLMLPLLAPERYMIRGMKITRGILLHGPPGCGKTMLCEAIAGALGLPWLPISGPSIVSGMSGESEKALRQHFEAAIEAAPCIMFIDEIDAITPKRENAQREMERRIVGQLLTCMDDLALEKTGGRPVVVLAATNRPDSLDPALRRAGRFDMEINVGVPTEQVRESILKARTRKMELAGDVDFKELARQTPGFVGADLEDLISKAGAQSNARYLRALEGMRREMPLFNRTTGTLNKGVETTAMDLDFLCEPTQVPLPTISVSCQRFLDMRDILKLKINPPNLTDIITMPDFLAAIPRVQPSAKREGFATIPDTKWEDIGALAEVRSQLHDAIVEPIRNPEKYRRFHISVPAGVLLWGPPGCGKTLLAKAVANESKANFISVKGPELLNKYVGESERAVRQVFFRAASSAPCVVFFDELDALVPRRDDTLSEASARVVNTLLTELDGLNARGDIYVIAATNRPEMIDPAMLRPGRLGKHLQVWLPHAEERVDILRTLLKKMPVRDADVDLTLFARVALDLENFSGADLSSLAYEAAQRAVRRDAEFLELEDVVETAKRIKPSVNSQDLARYERFKEGFFDRRMPAR